MPHQMQQIIRDRYIDQKQLAALLARNFTAGTYTFAVGFDGHGCTLNRLHHANP